MSADRYDVDKKKISFDPILCVSPKLRDLCDLTMHRFTFYIFLPLHSGRCANKEREERVKEKERERKGEKDH
jgi:hypothetical protein